MSQRRGAGGPRIPRENILLVLVSKAGLGAPGLGTWLPGVGSRTGRVGGRGRRLAHGASLRLPSWMPTTRPDGTGSWTMVGGAWATVPTSPVMWDCTGGVCYLCPSHSPLPLHLPHQQRSPLPLLGPQCCPPCLASPTLVAVVVGVVGPRGRWEWVGGWARAQGCDHLHDVGHDHLAGTHGLEPLGGDAIRVILNVQV